MSEPTQTNRKKSRRRNGDGNTYRHKNGWRTVISHKGHTVTAMGRSEQESRRLAKEKIKALPIYDGSLVPAAAKLTTGEFLTNWITKKHKTSIAATTYRRYASLINIHIIPALGTIKLQAVTKNHVNALMLQMREKGQSARSQQQARAVLSAASATRTFARTASHIPLYPTSAENAAPSKKKIERPMRISASPGSANKRKNTITTKYDNVRNWRAKNAAAPS